MNEDFQHEDAFLREAQRNEELIKREKLREVDFGLQVQKFLDGPIGRRILDDAEAELKEIASALFVERDVTKIREFQERAQVLQHWQDAFGSYIITGKNAEKELEQMD